MTTVLLLEVVTVESSWLVGVVPTDPATLKVAILQPDDTIVRYEYPTDAEIVRDGAGEYHIDVTATDEGTWRYMWEATGVDETHLEGFFVCAQEETTTLEILKKPTDFDAIRALLGVSAVDLKAEIIELPTYGQYIEARVKEIVTDWSTRLDDPVLSIKIRTATIYGVAASLAETYMKGGTVSLVHKEEPRRNWSEWARILWNRYREALARVTSPAGVNDDIFDMPGVTRVGPTKSRGTRPDWTGIYPPVWPLHVPE